MFLRNAACATFKTCKMVEFQASIATLVLELNLLSHATIKYLREDPRQTLDDQKTVDRVMGELASRPGDGTGVAPQAVKVLETLKSVASEDGTVGTRFKLSIPYFGTISIQRGPKLRHAKLDTSKSPGLAPADTLYEPSVSNSRPGLFIPPPMHDWTTSQDASLEWPQITLTSSLFANFNDSAAQLPEEDWSFPGLGVQFENSQIADLDGTWDWFGDDNSSAL